MISHRRPDLIIIGRESFIYGLPEFVHVRGVPCMLLAHGAGGAIVHGRYREDLAKQLLESMAQVDGIVTVARHMGEGLGSLGLSHVTTINNPVDAGLFAPHPNDSALRHDLGIAAEDFVVYHASNLKAVKRPLDLIAAAANAIQQKRNLRFLVVGDGPLKPEMMALCHTKGIDDRVRFEGWVANERLPAFLSLADVAVMCSETEGQPMPGAGLLTPVGDIVEMAEAVLSLARDKDLREKLGAAGRAKVLRDHDLSRVVLDYEDAIAAVIARAGGA
jgi:glycosyltransferase involved in cell wall biosynthesis